MMDGAARDRVWSLCWAALGFRTEHESTTGRAEPFATAEAAVLIAALGIAPNDIDALYRLLFETERDQEKRNDG